MSMNFTRSFIVGWHVIQQYDIQSSWCGWVFFLFGFNCVTFEMYPLVSIRMKYAWSKFQYGKEYTHPIQLCLCVLASNDSGCGCLRQNKVESRKQGCRWKQKQTISCLSLFISSFLAPFSQSCICWSLLVGVLRIEHHVLHLLSSSQWHRADWVQFFTNGLTLVWTKQKKDENNRNTATNCFFSQMWTSLTRCLPYDTTDRTNICEFPVDARYFAPGY